MKPILCLLALSSPLFAAFAISLPGNTETAGWDNLRSSNPYWAANGYPTSFPFAAAAWPAAIAANVVGSQGSAGFLKNSGNGYFASASLYDAGSPGIFSISDTSPLVSLASIVLQIDAGTSIGVVPVLNYNGGSQALAANYFAQNDGEYLTFNFQTGQSFPTQNGAWQWDLTGLGVTSYSVTWGSVPNNHLTQYELNLTTSDSFVQAIPEPTSTVMLSLASLAFFRRRR
ncbi:MAG: PEP-CTERM sorting domain-containing protein [Luteolibacter sp.]